MTIRIGIGLDETITALPAWCSVMTRAVLRAGGEVHVITYREGGTEDEVQAELAGLAIDYTTLHLPPSGVDAPTWKAGLAQQLDLGLMIEDSPEVLARMPARTGRMWLCDPAIFDLDVCVRAMSTAPAPKPLA